MERKEIRLQPRLACLAACVAQGARLADIGTDHGYLPIHLLQQGRISHAIASDLRPGPLEHAMRSARSYGIGDEMEFRLCNGLEAIAPDEVDTIVIAGMGGELIIKLLQAAPWTKERALTILLQPQTKADLLRAWLAEEGYRFLEEHLVRDKGTLYAVMSVTAGKSRPLTSAQALCGVLLEKDALYGEYLSEQIEKLTRALDGMKSAKRDATYEIDRLTQLLDELVKAREEWQHDNSAGYRENAL